MVRILLADDNATVRTALRTMLRSNPRWAICGEASNGREAIEQAHNLAPDLIIMDFLMPGMNGLEAAKEIERDTPGLSRLMFTMHLTRQLAAQARKAGDRGALHK